MRHPRQLISLPACLLHTARTVRAGCMAFPKSNAAEQVKTLDITLPSMVMFYTCTFGARHGR